MQARNLFKLLKKEPLNRRRTVSEKTWKARYRCG